jgi:pimeloyl-ACP methyl ester carboxylesterase
VATFALIHGSWHGAWCFEHLAPLLEGEGQRAIAVDLPCEDLDAGCAEYARIVADSLDNADDAIVVAHSFGGLTGPLVAELRPVRHLVFLCALLPEPGVSLREQLEHDSSILGPAESGTVRDEAQRSYWPDENAAIEALYHDCDPEVARSAAARLRHQARRPAIEPSPLGRWPAVPVTYVLCRDDRITNPQWSRLAAAERLGADPIELPGGHSPFLSRPGHVAELLLGIAQRLA